ncbi:hypothetical protein HBI23_154700 [Parastagonospora nodorum]|nr:hypothetical protein HBI12_153040 [Parastagonospora nodorum]KAH5418563.1 hypothetical protein HBI47_142640 [Parastagonospora nodorum]KAH5654620.1 hypothetical protein HBI23_154700 [Parastagonospora nodorum]KAH6057800.1 hypothetical protein HBI67_183000 [Parastagonospora nodorum]KAH6066717.1 hypothetical protein HBI66_152790 [Parastagonospora nodorum]
MSATTFLNLPREIRNIVYSYLTHDISIDWGYKTFPFPIGGHAAVKLHVKDAPFPDVLLVCSQVYHEYRQEKRHGVPCLAINVSPGRTGRILEGQPTNQGRVFKILSHANHLAFLYWGMGEDRVKEAWDNIEQLSGAVAMLAPDLRTVRVIEITFQNGLSRDNAEPIATTPGPISSGASLNELYRAALGTSLVTHGQLAFWNDRIESATARQDLVYRQGDGVTEWRYTRRKNDVGLEVLQHMYPAVS